MMENYIDLIYKQLDGTIAAQEARQLAQWREADSEHQAAYDAIIAAWEASDVIPALPREVNLDTEFKQVMKKINADAPVIDLDVQKPAPPSVESTKKAGRSASVFSISRILSIAASVALLIGGFWFFTQKENVEKERHAFVVETATQELVLPDQSVVVAKRGAAIAYATDFGENNRRLTFSGEGYFSVRPDADIPFIVESPRLSSTVMGTTFIIKDDNQTPNAEVLLLEGKLSVTTTAGNDVLAAGQQLIFEPTANTNTVLTDRQMELDRTMRKAALRFDNQPLLKVGQVVSSVFGVNVRVAAPLSDCAFTGQLPTDKFQEVLETLTELYGAKVKSNGVEYLVEGGACE